MDKNNTFILEKIGPVWYYGIVVIPNRHCNKELVNDPETTGKFMHRFSWLKDSEIGQLVYEWNWLAGWYKEPNGRCEPKAIHYTEGGPGLKNMNVVNMLLTGY